MNETSLPEGWTRQSLSEAAVIVMGQSPPSTAYNETGDGLPFFQGKAEFGVLFPTIRKWSVSGNKMAEDGDILISVRAPVGPTNLAPTKCIIGRGLAAIRSKSHIDQAFLLWSLRNFEADISSRGTGTTFDSISGDALKRQVLNIPPLDEQVRIVEILEEQLPRLDATVKSVQTIREKAVQFRRSLLHAAFTGDLTQQGDNGPPKAWRVEPLAQCCLKVRKVDPMVLGRSKFRYVDIGAIDNGGNSIRPVEPIDCETAPSRARQLLQTGDTVFSTVRPYLKNIAWVDESLDGEIASTGFCVLRPDPERLHHRYLFFYSISDVFLDQVLPLQRGVSYPAVRDGDLYDSSIPIPPLEEQERIVGILEEQLSRLDATLDVANEVERKAKAQRRSLLHAAFTGELTRSWREANV